MKQRSYRGVALVLGGAGLITLGLQGCATATEQDAGTNPQVSSMADKKRGVFPDPDDAWVKEGTYVNLENLRKMHRGISKDQAYDLLGRPHFSEGLFGVHEWNYIFHLPTGDGDYRTCQYQVRFDDDMLAESMYWREPVCAALLEPQEDKLARMSLSADTLFDFNSAELSPEGREQVIGLVRRIRGDFTEPNVMVVGHTDRLGSDAYNQTLSERRAATVRSVLVSNEVAPMSIRSRGAGERNPITQCEGGPSTPGLKECLQPNRRVDIEVSDAQR